MVRITKTVDRKLVDVEEFEPGIWAHLTAPTARELEEVSSLLNLDMDLVKAALDEEERARVEVDGDHTLIIVDIPIVEKGSKTSMYTTLPLGIVLTEDCICTVCLKETPLIDDFFSGRVRNFYTTKRTRFILQLLYNNATKFLAYLRQIDKASTRVEEELHKSMKNKELIEMLRLEKSLVFFSTSLKGNELVLEKLFRMDYIEKYPEDTDLLEDAIIENKQAIEMCTIYRDILSGTMDAFASVISNNLNIVMKFLAAVTILLALPTVVSGLWGMNFDVIPLANNPMGFWMVTGGVVVIVGVVALIMVKKNMF